MSIQKIQNPAAKVETHTRIIDGRQVKVVDRNQVKAISQRLITKHARAMEILKDR
ncbi:hypothetical protein [Microbulbifer sp. THAF38]|uniref:hypothetical protein n=1 Tax=Microbulbifer sp. THAF38 TaxID=2587856 RepID=UPI0012A90011|nr:hypothetical protein [Microbulbifer sp. THAF38]QFT53551.1 hypothetical protein FIU95_03060 [Microbulbifer sp. THAF38]